MGRGVGWSGHPRLHDGGPFLCQRPGHQLCGAARAAARHRHLLHGAHLLAATYYPPATTRYLPPASHQPPATSRHPPPTTHYPPPTTHHPLRTTYIYQVLTNVNKVLVVLFGVLALGDPITPISCLGVVCHIYRARTPG